MAITRFPIKNVFSTGEVSPRFEGRSDVGKYYAALKRLINFLPFTQGGVTRRPGLRFGRNNFCDLEGRIIPFKFTRDVDSNFLIHLCDESLTITDNEGNPVDGPAGACGDTGQPLALMKDGNIDCNVATPTVVFTASGGVEPYTWQITGVPADCISNMGQTISGDCDEQITITAPINSGGFGSTLAHYLLARSQDPNNCANVGTVCRVANFNCVDAFTDVSGSDDFNCTCDPALLCPSGSTGVNECANLPAICCRTGGGGTCCSLPLCEPAGAPSGIPGAPGELTNFQIKHRLGLSKDCRTGAMIAAGCRPCSLCMRDALVTVTDANLNMVSLAIGVVANF